MDSDVRLALTELTKRFGSVTVLDRVSLQVKSGEIHGLIGQNGAGKSTLVKTLAGIYPDHDGTVTVDGRLASLKTPRQSRSEGISVIYQEFSLVPQMTIADNLLLGQEGRGVRYSARKTRRRAEALLKRVNIDIGAPLDALVDPQSPAVKQRIEIAKALAQNARVLVMDEPTARLSDVERQWLFVTMRRLAEEGVGIIFISHFLEDVLGVTDWLTILRNGRVVASQRTTALSVRQMAELMLGTELRVSLEHHADGHPPTTDAPVLLEASHVSSGPRLADVSVTLRAGEVVGVAGLVGSGRTRLCRVLSGVDRPTSGQIKLHGHDVRFRGVRHAITLGVALIPEDRKSQGLSLVSSVSHNLCMMAIHKQLGRAGIVSRRAVGAMARQSVADLEVAPPRPGVLAATLSGGNQQKVVLGKVLAAKPKVLIVDQPTAGVDVGTKAQLHRLLRSLAQGGAALLVVSDDLDELYALSDRFCVMSRGSVLWEGAPTEIARDELLAMMSSGSAVDDPIAPGRSA